MSGKELVIKEKTVLNLLKHQHRAFTAAYVANGGNGTEAYMSAYPKAKYNTARTESSKLLTKPDIISAVEIESDKYWKGRDKTIEKSKTYQLIHMCGDVDVSDIFDNNYNIKDLNDIPLSARLAIQSVKKTEKTTKYGVDKTVEVTLVNKLSALELRAKMQGMLTTRPEFDDIIITVSPAIRPTDDDPRWNGGE